MSSRILRRGEREAPEPLAWRRVGPDPQRQGGERSGEAQAHTPGGAVRCEVCDREAELNRRVDEARRAGYQEGVAAGKKQAGEELTPVLERLAATIRELVELRPRLRRQAESDLVKLAVAIARRIVNRQLSVDPDVVQGLVSTALEKLRGQEIYRARVHPELSGALSSYLARSELAPGLELVADATQPRGGILFETSRGILDASVETQLKEIERGLTDRCGGQS